MEAKETVWISGGAGLGKSLPIWQVASKLIDAKKIPVVVEGYLYSGSLAQRIAAILKSAGAPVSTAVVEELMETFVILFDGFSEVRLESRDGARDELSPHVGNTPIIVASRQDPPPGPLLTKSRRIRLLAVGEDSLSAFLLKYLKGSETKAATLRAALAKQPRISMSEWTPLMLAMIAETYQKTGEVPASRSDIYGRFFDFLVREDAIGGISPAAVKYALEQLAGKTFLERGERGYGENEVLTVFAELRDELKARYDADVAASRLLAVIEGAGIFLRRARYLTFFHDSFESYVAARYLEDCFMQHSTVEIRYVAGRRHDTPAFAEAWQFLIDLVTEWGDTGKLRDLEETSQTG